MEKLQRAGSDMISVLQSSRERERTKMRSTCDGPAFLSFIDYVSETAAGAVGQGNLHIKCHAASLESPIKQALSKVPRV